MKTAVSIPNEIFEEAESLAHRLGVSRSELYSKALRAYVLRHAADTVAEGWDAASAAAGAGATSPFVRRAARKTLEATEW